MFHFLGLIFFCLGQGNSPNIILISVDTLRADRLGIYGYQRDTSPNLDALLRKGIVFENVRTPEPLTAPAIISMLTSVHPHQHGATRNGLAHRDDLPSGPKRLKARGYRTSAFVGNWTLKNRLTRIGTHFDEYIEVLDRKRWFGLFLGEADGSDLTDRAISWLDRSSGEPYFLWLHYSDPHAPYRLHKTFSKRLGLGSSPDRSDRYDSEIAFVDQQISRLLAKIGDDSNTLIIFTSDHGENLGEHGYWGHGRHLYDESLRIPMCFVWPGHLKPMRIKDNASLLDVMPTLLGVLAFEKEEAFGGYDWTPHFSEPSREVPTRTMYFQAHRGAVQTRKGERQGRLNGLLEVGLIHDGQLESYRVRSRKRWLFNLNEDPKQLNSLVPLRSKLSKELHLWAAKIEKLLQRSLTEDAQLDESDVEMLRSLGYID